MIDLRYGDCFDVMQDLIASNIKVEAVICDPPYNLYNGFRQYSQSLRQY